MMPCYTSPGGRGGEEGGEEGGEGRREGRGGGRGGVVHPCGKSKRDLVNCEDNMATVFDKPVN